MPRAAKLTLLALPALLLTGCGPTTADIQAMVNGSATKTYADALELRDDVIDAGLECPDTEQQQAEAGPFAGSTLLGCGDELGLIVTGSEEQLVQLNEDFGSAPEGYALQGANWMVLAETEAPLNQLQKDLGGEISEIS